MARADINSTYDPNEIVTRSQDEHGHSYAPRATLPKTWGPVIQAIVASEQWPEYKHVNDLIRDALYHRLYWIDQQKNRGNIPEVRAAIIRAQFLRRLESQMTETFAWEEFGRKIDEVLQEQYNNANLEGVRDFIEDFRKEILDVPEPSREKLEKQLSAWEMRVS